jgi:superoxide dismutase, Fe-Mn family
MFTLPKLPYDEDALAPHISARTMALHHGKHHKGYVETLNKLLVRDSMADLPLEDVIHRSHGLAARHTIFNNAAQAWNHDFFWKSMTPDGHHQARLKP